MEKGEKSLNYGEAALLIGISEGTLRNWLVDPAKPQPPRRKVGRKVLFYESEIFQWIANQPIIKTTAAKAAPKAKGKAIKLTFTAEEWQKMALFLIDNDIKDTDTVEVANYCKASLLNAAKEVLSNASKS